MSPDLTINIAKLRICVAFLGEKEQQNWWSSSFLSQSGEAFLSPVFPKTSLLSRVTGASMAAQIVHDEYIGVGDVYHLYRLPENLEQNIAQLLIKDHTVSQIIESPESAIAYLEGLVDGNASPAVGPLLLDQNDIDQNVIDQMASAYLAGFKNSEAVYPYYRSKV